MMADIKIAAAEGIQVSEEIEVEESCGNVFEDLGLPNADERLAKSRVALLIQMAIEKRGLSQRQAAQILGLDQANISRLMCGKLSGFTLDRLFRFMRALDMDIEVRVKEKAARPGHGQLLVHAVA
jgi:predicted XRE-type DNA-binding protein